MGGCCGRSHQKVENSTAKSPQQQQSAETSLKDNRKGPGLLKKSTVSNTTMLDNIRSRYTISKVIGNGHFGTVRIAHPIGNQNACFAIKSIQKANIKQEIHLLKRELDALRTVDHPNIIKFFETYEDAKYFHIVMEYCSGGELFEKIVNEGPFDEKKASKIVFKILSAINHLHEHHIVHRDLKPENFLFVDKNPDAEIKIIDFGLANKFGEQQNEKLHTVVGTPYYVAPEVLRRNYGKECDLWSIGVIMYILLSGSPPFIGDSHDEIFKAILKGKYNLSGEDWDSVSSEAKDLIQNLLQPDISKRFTCQQALNHKWFTMQHTESVKKKKINPLILQQILKYKANNLLKKEAMNVIVNLVPDEKIRDLKEVFRQLDNDHSGTISGEELYKAMQNLGMDVAAGEIKDIMQKFDKNTFLIGEMNYTEFIAATLKAKMDLNKEILWSAFKYFDVENQGHISAEGIKKAMQKVGRDLSLEEAEKIIRGADNLNPDGKIDFEEFCDLLTSKFQYLEDE